MTEDDGPILKGEYPVDIQGREHAVMGWLRKHDEALFVFFAGIYGAINCLQIDRKCLKLA